MRQELVGPSGIARVLRELEELQRLAGVARRDPGLVLQSVQAREGPVDPRAKNGIPGVLRLLDRRLEDLLGVRELSMVDVGVREQNAEADGFGRVLPLFGARQRLPEEA